MSQDRTRHRRNTVYDILRGWRGVAGGSIVLALLGFLQLTYAVRMSATLEFDRAVLLSIHATASEWQDALWLAITQLGGGVAVAVAIMTIAAVLYRKGHVSWAVQFAAGVGGAMALSTVLKLLFERARPELWQHLILETTYSFPSGHAIASSAIALSVATILWYTKWRILALILGAIYVTAIGYSRLYLGVHYPTDIVAGWLVSIAWIMIIALAFEMWRYRRRPATNVNVQ